MVDGGLRSDSDASTFGSVPTPWGFAARYSPRDLAGYWLEVVALGSGRTGVLLGCCDSSRSVEQLRSDALAALLESTDPARSLSGLAGSDASAVCAVIDLAAIRYSSLGHPGGIIAAPGRTPALLECTEGRVIDVPLQPGSTVLLCTGAPDKAVGVLDGDSSACPRRLPIAPSSISAIVLQCCTDTRRRH